jgi:hypothetical protein
MNPSVLLLQVNRLLIDQPELPFDLLVMLLRFVLLPQIDQRVDQEQVGDRGKNEFGDYHYGVQSIRFPTRFDPK